MKYHNIQARQAGLDRKNLRQTTVVFKPPKEEHISFRKRLALERDLKKEYKRIGGKKPTRWFKFIRTMLIILGIYDKAKKDVTKNN